MFLGSIHDLPRDSFSVLKQFDNQWTLTNMQGKFSLISNVCPHQSSLIADEESTSRVCPYHAWSFDIQGYALGSGSTNCSNSLPLAQKPVYEWNTLLFSEPVHINLQGLDLSNFRKVEERIDIVKSNWINIMMLFLDVDHIPVVHKGVYDKIGINRVDDITWKTSLGHSVQLTSLTETKQSEAFTKTLSVEKDVREFGSAWIGVYPHTMIEWQPGGLFITVTVPVSATETKVVVYKYADTRYSGTDNWEINNSVWETAWAQDKAQAEKLVNSFGPNLEQPKQQFISWALANGHI